MSSIDTNLVLRIMLQDIPEQKEKVFDLIDSSKSHSLLVEDAVFFECVWVLSGKMYAFDRTLIGKLLLQVSNIQQIKCNRAMLERAVPLYVKHSQISFVDACLAAYAELNDAKPLLTFDKKLARALPQAVSIL